MGLPFPLSRWSWPLWRIGNRLLLAVEGPLIRGGAVCRGPDHRPWVALTFDDGPDPQWTPGVLEVLERFAAQATFFFIAEHLEAHPQLAGEVARRHQVGTHLLAHRRGLTRDRIAGSIEIERALATHERILGRRPNALRFPFGQTGRFDRARLAPWGVTAYHWTFSSHDSRAETAEAIVDHVLPRISPGAIVLLHDGRGPGSTRGPGTRAPTIAALPRILAELDRRGWRAVTLDRLMAG